MEGAWLVAFIGLWILSLAELAAIIGLVQQLGLLHLRLGPAPGPLFSDEGLPLGAVASARDVVDVVSNRTLSIPAPSAQPTILVFLDPGCATCIQLLRGLNGFSRAHTRDAALVAVSRSKEVAAREMARSIGALFPIVPDPEGAVFDAFRVANTPFGYLVQDGYVRMKGIVNHRDHVEALLAARGTDQGDRQFVPLLGEPASESVAHAAPSRAG